MAKKTPKDIVREKWQTKQAAAQAIIGLIGDSDGKTAQRLKRASNLQLLQLHRAGETVREKFSSREGLENAIMELKFPKGAKDDTYRNRLGAYGIKRLLDLHTQLSN